MSSLAASWLRVLPSLMALSTTSRFLCFEYLRPHQKLEANLSMQLILNVLHCIPIHAYWDTSVPGASCPYRDPTIYHANVGLQYIHLLADVALLIIPALQVQKLRLNRSKKFGLTALFMFGIFVCVATIAVIVYSTKYDPSISTEFSWSVSSIFIWTIAEVNLAIASSEQQNPCFRVRHADRFNLTACLPLLRPLFKSIGGNSTSKSKAPAPPKLPTLHGYQRKDSKQKKQGERTTNMRLQKGNLLAHLRRTREGSRPDEIEMGCPRLNHQGEPGMFDGTLGSEVVVTSQERSTCRDYFTSAIMVKSECSVDVARAV